MLEGHANGWPGAAGGATAHRIDDHQNRAAVGRKNPVDIGGRACLFDTVSGKVGAHGGDENFRVGHESILAGRSSSRPVLQKGGGGFEERLQDLARLSGERRFIQRAGHQLQPAVARRLSDGKWRVADAQPGMAALLDVGLRAAETENQEIAQPLSRAFQIFCWIHGPEDVVARNLAIKRVGQALESGLADG